MIYNHEDWKKEYRKDKTKTWIICKDDTGKDYFFKDYEEWYEVKRVVRKLVSIKLQYRSNIIEENLEDSNGVYFVRSAIGRPGAETIYTMTIGKIVDDEVHKKVYTCVGLMLEDQYIDEKQNCFREAMLEWAI